MYKGALYENMVADCFAKHDRKLYYYHKESGLEIDFVTVYDGKPTLVEVKATSGNTKSANTVLKHYEQYGVDFCIKLGDSNIGQEGNMLSVPSYMSFLLF